MKDFVHDRKKNLDLVLCTASEDVGQKKSETFAEIGTGWKIDLTEQERTELSGFPVLRRGRVSSVLIALEAKACMTAHQRALPRLYDELNSSHATVHGSSDQAIAAGFVIFNRASTYLSPDLNKKNRATDPEWSRHSQPRDAQLAVDKVHQLPKRSRTGDNGYDALAILSRRGCTRAASQRHLSLRRDDRPARPHLRDPVQGPLTGAPSRNRAVLFRIPRRRRRDIRLA